MKLSLFGREFRLMHETHEIDDDAGGHRWDNTEKPIRHILVTLLPKEKLDAGNPARRTPATDALVFGLVDVSDGSKAGTLANMAAHAKTKAITPTPRPRVLNSPLDLEVGDQSWLLFELDSSVNWQFMHGEHPCKIKKMRNRGDNRWLRHIYRNTDLGMLPTGHLGNVELDDCRFAYFAVAHRKKRNGLGDDDPGSCRIDLNVELLQRGATSLHKLPLIIDPDVKNDGGEEYPS